MVDLDVHLLGLRQHQHAGGRGVDPALRLGHRHPLDAVHATLELELRVRRVARLRRTFRLHRDGDRLVPAEIGLGGVQHLGLPALRLGVLEVHLEQVAGEQRGLVAALAGLDLQDRVLVVARVPRDQQEPQLLGELIAAVLQPGRLLGERRVLPRELARGPDIARGPQPLVVRADDRRQPGVPLADPARHRLVRVQRRVRHLPFQIGVLRLQPLDRLEHPRLSSSSVFTNRHESGRSAGDS